jgi:AraC-like DNA-binding protein
MRAISLVRSSVILPVGAFLERAGAPLQGLLGRTHLPAWALTDREALIPAFSLVRLLAHAGVANVGLRSGEQASIESLGIYGRLVRRSPTLRDALDAIVRHYPAFSSSGRIWLAFRGDDVDLCQTFAADFDLSEEGWQQATHYLLTLVLGVVRLGAGATWRPDEVRLQAHASPALRDAELLSGARLRFDQPLTAITLPRTLLDKRLPPAPSKLDVPAATVEAWKASAPARDFAGSIVQVIETLSWEGYPDIHLTADVLGMSVRTLQRHLASAGFTHESLVGRARFVTAAALLKETDAKILDIALDLGYSDHAHFTRAFRRWAGCSPQEYRANAGDRAPRRETEAAR